MLPLFLFFSSSASSSVLSFEVSGFVCSLEQTSHGINDDLGLGERQLLEVRSVRSGNVSSGHSDSGGIKVVKT